MWNAHCWCHYYWIVICNSKWAQIMKWIPQRALNVVIWDMCYCPWCWVGLKTSFLVMKILLEKTQCFPHWFFFSRIFLFFFQKHCDFPIKISILRVKNVWFFFSREQFGHNLGWFCAIWASQFGQNKSQHRLRPKHRVPGRRLRVGITSIICDANHVLLMYAQEL